MLMRQALVLLTLFAAAPSACQPRPTALTDADRGAIRAVEDNFVKAVLAADWAGAASAYAEDAITLPPNGPAVQGRAAIQNLWAGLPKVTAFTVNLAEIEGQSDLAYARGTYELTLMPPGAKGPAKDTGKFLEIRRKQPNGSWLIFRDIWNSDLPLSK